MGAQNVAKVFAHWRHLSHREARALLFMANTALDADKPPVYFGGWEAVAAALGLDCEGKRHNSKEQFRRTIAGLVASGAVVSSGQAKLGVRAEYALTLDPESTVQPVGVGRNISWKAIPRSSWATQKVPHLDPSDGAPPPTQKVPHMGPPKGGERAALRVPPRSTEEPQGGAPDEKRGEIQSSSAFSLTNGGMEENRRRQLDALKKLIDAEEKAS